MTSKEILLNHAEELFSQRGYHSVGVQEIVTQAGVTKPTLYHHFGSKAGLLKEIFIQGTRNMETDLGEVFRYSGDLTADLERLLTAFFRFSEAYPHFCRLFLVLAVAPVEDETQEVTAGFYQVLMSRFENFFRDAAEGHGNMRGRERLNARSFWGMVSLYLSLGLSRQEELTPELAFWAVKQYIHGILS